MNEQAQQVLANMMQRALDGVDAAVDFSQAQIPDVVEQLLMWHMVESLIFFTIGVVICASMAPFFKIAKRAKSNAVEDRKNKEPWTIFREGSNETSHEYDFIVSPFLMLISFLPIIPGFILIAPNLDWLKILIAPKLYLLEYAASLVK